MIIPVKDKGQGHFLIVEGFPYHKDIQLQGSIYITGVKEGAFILDKGSTLPVNLGGGMVATFKLEKTTIATLLPENAKTSAPGEKKAEYMANTLGLVWEFQTPGIIFSFKGYTFETESKNAKFEFITEGILVKGFKITQK